MSNCTTSRSSTPSTRRRLPSERMCWLAPAALPSILRIACSMLWTRRTMSSQVFDADTFKPLRQHRHARPKHLLPSRDCFLCRPMWPLMRKEMSTSRTRSTTGLRSSTLTATSSVPLARTAMGRVYFARPKGIAIDADGHIWVVDGTQQRVQVFNNEGRLLIYFGEHGSGRACSCRPNDIAIDKTNRVFISEQFQGRVQMFRYVTDAEAEQERKERELLQGSQTSLPPRPTPRRRSSLSRMRRRRMRRPLRHLRARPLLQVIRPSRFGAKHEREAGQSLPCFAPR